MLLHLFDLEKDFLIRGAVAMTGGSGIWLGRFSRFTEVEGFGFFFIFFVFLIQMTDYLAHEVSFK